MIVDICDLKFGFDATLDHSLFNLVLLFLSAQALLHHHEQSIAVVAIHLLISSPFR